ncbi:hypothetical protein N7495_002786 [Penicillium taxi]|uniref:uncharacterized protein n=1 Tax=Penicillium taxi TaxID=168475 RepID=UPI0025456E6C|nr:uncharacterized protein N7495_002786 [Penicillium taxi]KAJ5902258.1 hypothetical protein N7495_002786 [Penicillium taxi]
MPTEYALKSNYREQEVAVHSADLYLLQEWDDGLAISDKDQRSKIFNKWLEIGLSGRMPYTKRLEEMHSNDEDIADHEKDLLIRVRGIPALQAVGDMCIVRTFYGDGSNEAFDEMIRSTDFNDPALLDEGSKDGLQSLHNILILLPQIIESSEGLMTQWADGMVEIKEEAKQAGLANFPPEEFDQEDFDHHMDMLQSAAQFGHVLVYDKEAHNTGGSLMMLYLDNLGRIIRHSRLDGYGELTDVMGLFLANCYDEGTFPWENGEPGEHWKPDQMAKRWGEIEPLEEV